MESIKEKAGEEQWQVIDLRSRQQVNKLLEELEDAGIYGAGKYVTGNNIEYIAQIWISCKEPTFLTHFVLHFRRWLLGYYEQYVMVLSVVHTIYPEFNLWCREYLARYRANFVRRTGSVYRAYYKFIMRRKIQK